MDKIDHASELSDYLFSDQPEIDYSQKNSKEKSRKFGQYFTPYSVARLMADWVNQANTLSRVLDPAVGLGIFFRALLKINPNFNGTLIGYEIDPDAHKNIQNLFSTLPAVKTNFKFEDFLLARDAEKYDGILCNPPYIRYKQIVEREKLIKRIEVISGITINPQSNIYTYFIILGTLTLAPKARAAFLVPSEFLNSEFGIPIKDWLISQRYLKKVILFDPRASIFSGSITTSCILLLENNGQDEQVQFAQLNSGSRTEDLQLIPQPQTLINPRDKWTVHFNRSISPNHSSRLIPFSQIGRVSRGIASGDNRFFTFNLEKIYRYQIPENCLLPCLTRASQAQQPIFTQEHFDRLTKANKPVYLLDANRDQENKAILSYLDLGRTIGSHTRYLTRNRDPWFRLEQRPPAPILATTFNRLELRFVRNEASVYNLTCFHSIYINKEFESTTDLLMAYLLTPTAHNLINRNRREYGNGLIKFEPNDLNNALIVDITQVDSGFKKEILSLYQNFRQLWLTGYPNLDMLKQLDVMFSSWIAK